jgi:hypothetical protein
MTSQACRWTGNLRERRRRIAPAPDVPVSGTFGPPDTLSGRFVQGPAAGTG